MYNSRQPNNYPTRGKRHGAFVWERATPETEKHFARSAEECQIDSEKDLNYTMPLDVAGAAAMQGWADGLTEPAERLAHQRQFAARRRPSSLIERNPREDTVASLLQPDLYRAECDTGPPPLFTR
ncbi:unnamed protein product [Echinostoma caproni]|uniref:SCP domain-containing protein n=1 Tax=Echinostoma caproni TaxID=27848 RepID=A0A183B205_9TREM|nr:unnamed protein product [Echinostoma caproni]